MLDVAVSLISRVTSGLCSSMKRGHCTCQVFPLLGGRLEQAAFYEVLTCDPPPALWAGVQVKVASHQSTLNALVASCGCSYHLNDVTLPKELAPSPASRRVLDHPLFIPILLLFFPSCPTWPSPGSAETPDPCRRRLRCPPRKGRLPHLAFLYTPGPRSRDWSVLL